MNGNKINGNKFNGNKFKGNKQKKVTRGRKDVYADFDPETDHYGKIKELQGGKHASVSLLPNGTIICANLRGIHHKKVWFKRDDLVVIRGDSNFAEVWGKVNDNECNDIRRKFDKLEGKDNNMVVFNESDDSDDDYQQPTEKSGQKSQMLRMNPMPVEEQSSTKVNLVTKRESIQELSQDKSAQTAEQSSKLSLVSQGNFQSSSSINKSNLRKKPAIGDDEPVNIEDL